MGVVGGGLLLNVSLRQIGHDMRVEALACVVVVTVPLMVKCGVDTVGIEVVVGVMLPDGVL